MTFEELSNPARALLASLWMNPRFTLRYGMVENIPSPAAEDALSQLVKAGLLTKEDQDCGGRIYVLTDLGAETDRRPPGETTMDKIGFIDAHGRFPLAIKRAELDQAAAAPA